MLANHLKLASLALFAAFVTAAASAPSPLASPQAAIDGVVQVPSAYSMDETIARLKHDIAGKGITFFAAIDQSKLAADAGITVRPSTLLVFGNPALGSQFVTSKAVAGLDWPVRLLVYQDQTGKVWAAYTDFMWIAQRHHISDRDAAFNKATEVIMSITSSISDGKE